MKKYYYNDGTAQQGPFTIEELTGRNITSETPVWYDGLPDWTTAGQVEELKNIFAHTPPPFHAVAPTVVEPSNPVTPAVATAGTKTAAPAAPVTATTTPAKSEKKSTAWLSYVLALLVFGGVGYLVYGDMEKNKGNNNSATTTTPASDSTANTTMQQPTTEQPTSTIPSADDTTKTETITTTTTEPATTTATTTTTTVTPTTTQPATVTITKPVATKPTPAEIKAKQIEAQKLAQKKAEEEKKKLQAALAAAAAKEKEYRNNWQRYITFGKLDYNTKGDGIDAFNVPVFNGTNALLDKVTVRVDYIKKDKKIVKSETIVIYNIPPGTGLNGKAPEYKKGDNVKVFITGITSRKLHFCFPANNGNPADPHFCN